MVKLLCNLLMSILAHCCRYLLHQHQIICKQCVPGARRNLDEMDQTYTMPYRNAAFQLMLLDQIQITHWRRQLYQQLIDQLYQQLVLNDFIVPISQLILQI